MNTPSLKTFAQNARNKLRAQVATRLNYWLGAEGGAAPDTAAHRQFAPQIKELAEALKKEGRDGLVERISYTWFNRLVALRFMDANDFHPFGVRVVTPASGNEILPALLQQARSGVLNPEIRAKLANPQSFDDILAGRIPVAHQETELFGMLLLAACNYYHAVMPFLFEKLGDATQLLLPEDLLSEQSILTDIRENLTDEDCAEVEVIGWLYQFYISEKKAEVDARKTIVPQEDIPAKTQLFTPHWIVRYLVENSLGRLWLLNRPHSRLRVAMSYYIEGDQETEFLKIEKPEDIKLVDPAVGSGHMLTYAFDLLYLIYEEEGYDAPEIPSLILRHNLHGLEICDRAAALAAFALCMKARTKDRRFFKRLAEGADQAPRPHIIELQDVRFAESELRDYISALKLGNIFQHTILKLLHQFEEAKNFGSLIQPCETEFVILEVRSIVSDGWSEITDHSPSLFLRETHHKVLRVLEQAEALTQRYHVAVANPPYLGGRQMNARAKKFAEDVYPHAKADLFAMFIERSFSLAVEKGFTALVTMQSWMFLSSFEDLRVNLLATKTLLSMAHLGPRAFDTIGGEVVQATSFVAANVFMPNRHGVFLRLTIGKSESEKDALFRQAISSSSNALLFGSCAKDFQAIPGSPIAYWASEPLRRTFSNRKPVSEIAPSRPGLQTGDNPTFVRLWHEISRSLIGMSFRNRESAKESAYRWFPYNKGGTFRRWYGNCEFVVDWENDGARMKKRKADDVKSGRITANNSKCWNQSFYFQESVSWSKVSGSDFAARHYPEGFVFDIAGCSVFFSTPEETIFAIGFFNSTVTKSLVGVLSETINFEAGNIAKLPFPGDLDPAETSHTAKQLVALARTDWNNFETSWEFIDHPLLRPGMKRATLEASWRNWEAQSTAAIRRMQELETENNRLFIAAYGLESELQPEVPEGQITLARPDARRDVAAFISYAVGCMMGRYSLDQPGLILADADSTVEDYNLKVPSPTFAPDEDGILPVLDGEWFTDDIVGRFREFLRITFGEESFAASLRFIEESLGKPEAKTGKIKPTGIRSYFAGEFYKNHISTERAYGYKKRPIYWMVSSPNGSFQALIYLHRYTRDTMNHLLDRYVRAFLDKLEQRQQACTVISTDDSAKPAARTAAQKELIKLGKMLKEIREWERDTLLPIAQKRIELDLDDGVKVNYLKFKGVLVPIAGLEKKEED